MKSNGKWSTADIPAQNNRIAVITGSTSGIGYEIALALAKAGAQVVITGRNEDRTKNALGKILQSVPAATVNIEIVDLADLSSVNAFGVRMNAKYPRIDLLVNNAAVMNPQTRQLTKDGFELTFGTNYLGHFALTAHLLPLLKKGNNPRVVTLAALAPGDRSFDFDNIQSERSYKPMTTYLQSKLANVMFAIELQRLSDMNNWGIMNIVAHPGLSSTNLGASDRGKSAGFRSILMSIMLQSAAAGALPALFAATSPEAKECVCYAPDGRGHTKGSPTMIEIKEGAKNIESNSRLWGISEKLTGIKFV
jgi:NAD(P)-dependent dehydrogenase (short-subunit alcohol dehydrogenase family)